MPDPNSHEPTADQAIERAIEDGGRTVESIRERLLLAGMEEIDFEPPRLFERI